ncbi:MAG: hypothetical protein LBG65_01150 [Puniceicoccales bacterium]|jgi:hypothetical protein|nr:hypothetical protein [Puniceicoccales bacterium]
MFDSFPAFSPLAAFEFLPGNGKFLLRAATGVFLLLLLVYLFVMWWNVRGGSRRACGPKAGVESFAHPETVPAGPAPAAPVLEPAGTRESTPPATPGEFLLHPETRRAAVAAAIILAAPPSLSRRRWR